MSVESIHRELVEDGQVEFEIFARPSGQVKLFVVSRTPLGPQTDTVFQGIRTGIEAIENFMGPPWVKTDVIVYLEPGIRYIREVSGLNYGSHILIQPDPSTPYFKDVLYHELAHFYFGYGNAPRWLAEGGANFLESYTIHVSEDASMQSRYDLAQQSMLRRCLPQGISKVNELLEATAFLHPGVYLTSSLWPCTYPVGESFLLGIYIAFGHDVVSSSMRSLYKRGLTSYSPASEDEIVWTFLSNVPEQRQEEFRDLYNILHGRPIPEYRPPGTPVPPASPVPTAIPVPTATPPTSPSPTGSLPGSAAEDREALLALFRATNGRNWANNENWLTNTPMGDWHGIETDSNGRVTHVDLRENRLVGQFPKEIGRLGVLRVLNLGNKVEYPCEWEPQPIQGWDCRPTSPSPNRLTGELPAELGDLINLEEIDLRGNQLDGSIPARLGICAA